MTETFKIILMIGSAVIAFNWLTTIYILIGLAITKRNSSHLWIPFVGPVCMTTLLFTKGAPLWTLPIPWVADVGTIVLIAVSPRMFKEYWRISRFTQLAKLEGHYEVQTAQLTLHRGQFYGLTKKWHRDQLVPGIVQCGDMGAYTFDDPDIVLANEMGTVRRLVSEGDGRYAVVENGNYHEEYSLQGWVLRIVDGDISQCLWFMCMST